LSNKESSFVNRLQNHTRKGGQPNYAFGWRDCGYPIVAKLNSPSNSPAILHFTPSTPFITENGPVLYKPPFPRTESRITHVVSNDKSNLDLLEKPENKSLFKSFHRWGKE
jgi:hypothetical protein